MPVHNLYFLDITQEVCPLTFVRTKLLIERLKPGEIAQIRLAGSEPLANVPRSISELGHEILMLEPEVSGASNPEAVHLLRVRKK